MRRVYYLNPKRQQIVQEAILQMRATREALGPETMTRLKLLVKDFDPECLSAAPAEEAGLTVVSPEREPVDQKKNLLIIMKFLQLKQHNKSVQTQVRTLLAENNSL